VLPIWTLPEEAAISKETVTILAAEVAVEKEEVVTIVARVRKDQTVIRRRWLCQCLRN
jgi:hypothetical protein